MSPDRAIASQMTSSAGTLVGAGHKAGFYGDFPKPKGEDNYLSWKQNMLLHLRAFQLSTLSRTKVPWKVCRHMNCERSVSSEVDQSPLPVRWDPVLGFFRGGAIPLFWSLEIG
ncbi:hypothetical protein V1517DRAFT_371969 [Lipomyces orientalis]|uniref:Uncharacterized protein n=1 Tax=Lipomyces orientalis TaxID=1233043 RepID=A0ACC3TTC5_9ASCO